MGQIGDPYATIEEMKQYQKMSTINQGNTSMDASITSALDAASRQVEQFCGRQFNKSELATPRRFYVYRNRTSVAVDDFWSSDLIDIPDLDQFGYELEPFEGVVDGVPGWPYYRISINSGKFAIDGKITVTAKWGWAAVPSTVKQATLIIANQLLRLSDAPLGVTGMDSQNGGPIRVRDIPQVAMLLNRFISTPILVG